MLTFMLLAATQQISQPGRVNLCGDYGAGVLVQESFQGACLHVS